MRFLPSGPDIPPELIAAQEKGEVIFVCGAGVSRTGGLPLFRGLVERVYQELGEIWLHHPAENEGMREGGHLEGQYDRVLQCLHRRLAASNTHRSRGMRERILSAVRRTLKPPDDVDLGNHLALLKLSRDEDGRTRLLTTNFDTLFERAWVDKRNIAIASHAGSAMPQPKVAACEGVLHLHGRLADPRPELKITETDLVLTSAEFGDAYLRLGWASRYVYDLVRAYTVVLVGYQADDPPMRYLLEALEADRERYTDLNNVYALAPRGSGDEKLVTSLWEAKGTKPILYASSGEDHSALYETLREWSAYADDPTEWRRNRLRSVLTESPGHLTADKLDECTALLGHGDANQLLAELSPSGEWLSILIARRFFGQHDELPGEWIAQRVHDPSMIRACVALSSFDDQCRWHISRTLERDRAILSPVHMKAWGLLLRSKRPVPIKYFDEDGHSVVDRIRRGDVDFETLQLVGRALQPRLGISKEWTWNEGTGELGPHEALHELMQVEFEPAHDPSAEEILEAWPPVVDLEIGLLKTLDRALQTALEEAEDCGYLTNWDRASYDVPSVADHLQNANRTGFYPVTRAIANLWRRIADVDAKRARILADPWKDSRFLLLRRIALFAFGHAAYTSNEVAAAYLALDDRTFWLGGAQVEIMRGLVGRWEQFTAADRSAVESRLRDGIPRALFDEGSISDEEEWESISDSSIYRRLTRIAATGVALSPESKRLLTEIATRHPKWEPHVGDRDDFHSWSESSWGPSGDPGLLAGIADKKLVAEATRLQREQAFEQHDVWRLFCQTDPERALRALRHEADRGSWNSSAWRSLLWAADEGREISLILAIADMILQMPASALRELLTSATDWLRRQRHLFSDTQQSGGARFLPLWDRLAEIAYSAHDDDTNTAADSNLSDMSLTRPGGVLAWALLDSLWASKPQPDNELPADLKVRFTQLMAAPGQPGLLARVMLLRSLARFEAVDRNWTEMQVLPQLAWDHPDALPLWRSYARGEIGSARLFNSIKPAMLTAFARGQLSDHEIERLVSQLLQVGLWHLRGESPEYSLTTSEIRQALTIGPSSARAFAAWDFWRIMAKAADELGDTRAQWRDLGPLLRDIWPLDARLRSASSSRNLVLMTLECGEAFPDAVDAVVDLLVPYERHWIAHALRYDKRHDDLLRKYPRHFLRLASALIDPALFPIPDDLQKLLKDCAIADPTVVSEPAYIRLDALRRSRSA